MARTATARPQYFVLWTLCSNNRRVTLRTTPFKELDVELADGARLTLSHHKDGDAWKLEYALETATTSTITG